MLSPLEAEAVSLSLRVAFWSVLCSLPPGVAGAWLRNMDPNLPAPISPTRTGLPASARRRRSA